jgi:hypothetical protein
LTDEETVEEEVVDKAESEAPAKEQTENPKPVVTDESEAEEAAADAPYWAEDWREKVAEHASAGDKKAYTRELKRLGRLKDPSAIYGMYRELESKFTSGNLLKMPGEDASEEELKEFHAQIGVPESKDDYLADFTYADGEKIGEEKEEVAALLESLHESGATIEAAHAVLNHIHKANIIEAEILEEGDEEYRIEAQRALKEELGSSYKRTINNIAQVFRYAPGGTDLENEDSVRARLLGGRTADGVRIGDDPDIVRWLAAISQELDPVATVMDTTAPSGRGLDERIKEIEKFIRTNKHEYFKDQTMQDEYQQLLTAREKVRATAR